MSMVVMPRFIQEMVSVVTTLHVLGETAGHRIFKNVALPTLTANDRDRASPLPMCDAR